MRRLDGHSLYSPSHVWIRAERQAVVTAFDIPDASSDGGRVLLAAVDAQLQLTKRMAACLVHDRQPAKVRHQINYWRTRTYGVVGPPELDGLRVHE